MRKKRVKVSMKQAWEVQKTLTNHTDTLMSYLSLANIIADKMGWPKIKEEEKGYKEFSKQYIIKYLVSLGKDKSSTTESWLYLIRCGTYIQVGVSDDVGIRMSCIQESNPIEVSLEFRILCPSRRQAYNLEESIKKIGRHHHVRGDWYKDTIMPEVDAFDVGK